MPLYQFWCDDCLNAYEIQMTLAKLEEYDKKNKVIKCPNCKENLKKLICPTKIIRIN